jgi:hypothetical protein
MLEVALKCIARGWHVFPCWPKTKRPMTQHGWHDASATEEQIRAWWTKTPNANVAIACNPSNLAVLDIDHGLGSVEDLELWIDKNDLYVTRSVRTGRRPDYGVQLYYEGAIPDVGLWKLDGCEGQVKSLGGYVMAAGSIHPDSGQAYEVLWDEPHIGVNPTPDALRALRSEKTSATVDDGAPITGNRNNTLTSIAGKLRNAGLSAAALEVALIQVNADRCIPPLSESEVQRIAANAAKWEMPQDAPTITLARGAANLTQQAQQGAIQDVDWRTHYHSRDEMENAPPPSFLIEDFLQVESITALAAPVGQRKSLIALNVAHALCTGEALFGRFAVTRKPERVLYLCPEMGLQSFTDRLRKIGLMPYVGESIFCRTMSMEGELALDDMLPEELLGAVVIIDTAVRYLKGDENSSEHMRAFAESVFRLRKDCGAAAVLLLHHSAKGTKESNELTLENAMRGSGELGAFVTSCWATKLHDPTEPYKSASFLTNVKQRDFESLPFDVTCDVNCKLSFVEQEGVPVLTRSNGNAKKDGLDVAAMALVKANPKLSLRKMADLLHENGIKRSANWVSERRHDLLQENGGMMP